MSVHKIGRMRKEGKLPPLNGTDPVKLDYQEGYGYLLGVGTAVPSDGGTGWAKGAEFIHVDGTSRADIRYVNEGDKDSCNFDSLTNPVAGDLAVTYGSILLGNSSGVAAELVAKTAGQLLMGNGTTLAALDAKGDGKILIGNGTTAAMQSVSGDVTLVNSGATTLNTSHSRKEFMYQVEDLDADGDIAARPIFRCAPAATLVSAGILTYGNPAGVDDANTAVIALKDGAGNTIVTKTYNTGTQPPDTTYGDLGTLDATHKVLTAGELVTLTVTCGSNANLPAFGVFLVYEPTNA